MRKRKISQYVYGLWAALLGMSCLACGGGDDSASSSGSQAATAVLQVSTTQVTLDEQNTGSFTVTANNTSWTVFPLDTWIQCSPTSGSTTQTVRVTATGPNPGSQPRSGSVVVTDTSDGRTFTVTVVQNVPIVYSLTLDKTAVNISADGGSEQLAITTNDDWSIAGSNEWCYPSVQSGSGTATITLQVVKNTNQTSRTATLTVTGTKSGIKQTVTVAQEAAAEPSTVGRDDYGDDTNLDDKGYSLVTNLTSLSFTANGGTQAVNVISNDTWTVSSSDSWCTVSPDNGSNNGSISVTTAKNTSSSSRSTSVLVVGAHFGMVIISVTQEATNSEGSTVGRGDYDDDKSLD